MSSIKIISMPPGFAPEEIRKQWIGIELPLASQEDILQKPVSGLKIGNQNNDGYVVVREKAVEALHVAGKHEAAEFWNMASMIFTPTYLEFRKDICEVVG